MAVVIRKLVASKGFLAGLDIEPAPGFTVIVGHPGAFKSTIVETTRWVLNCDAERIRERIAATLGGGVARCDLTVNGEACALERGSGWDSPSAVPLGKRPIPLDALGAAIYSQGELRQLADQVERRLALLDAANESRMQELADRAREATRAHENACALLRPKRKEIEGLVENVRLSSP